MLHASWTEWRLRLGLLLAGALHALSFAPVPFPAWALSPLQLATMAWLIYAIWHSPNARFAAGRAWLFALAHFMVGLYWLTISMHTYGFIPLPLAILALAGLASYLALFASLAAWIAYPTGCFARSSEMKFKRAPLLAALVWASAWTITEWLRATLFTGFPWLNTGYAHMDSWFANWSALLGVYGVTFITAFTAAAFAGLIGDNLHPGIDITASPASTSYTATDTNSGATSEADLALVATHQAPRSQPTRALPGAIAVILLLAGGVFGLLQWSTPAGTPIVVRLVQGNVDQAVKFAPDQIMANIAEHLKLAGATIPAGGLAPQIVLLPETALAVFQHQVDPAVWQAWRNLAARQGSTILMGAALYDANHRTYTNSVISLNAETSLSTILAGTTAQRYDKHHLVPFGEFIPWGFRWFVDLMQIPMGDFNRGALVQPSFAIAGQEVAVNICYEDVFGEELIPVLPGPTGATILANFSNLGWFGNSFALRQHWQMSRMRALETARPMLRATNTGTTGAIDARGQAIAMLPAHQPGVLDVSVQGQSGLTPYARLGNVPVLLLSAGILCAALIRRRRAVPA
jgi:apolipoprotein N-acyltransferase